MYFTICIPTYNRAHTILRTLESLESQNFDDFEIVIIDDGSTDNTEVVIRNFKETTKKDIKYFKKKNGGKHTALNLGISKAKGEFFCILDSDDWLRENALNQMYEDCSSIANQDSFCGIMGRSMLSNGNIIGNKFPSDSYISSYVDFHFISGPKLGPFGDCCECIKTKILKNYSFPENKETKFVPEAFVFDQIGTEYNLLCTNNVYKVVEYQQEGISNNKNFKNDNIVGYLYHYVSRIDNVIPKIKSFPIKIKIISWWRYWTAVKLDPNNKGPRVKKITIMGHIILWMTPILNWIYKTRYKDIYNKGR